MFHNGVTKPLKEVLDYKDYELYVAVIVNT
jgi:hypothetical protein